MRLQLGVFACIGCLGGAIYQYPIHVNAGAPGRSLGNDQLMPPVVIQAPQPRSSSEGGPPKRKSVSVLEVEIDPSGNVSNARVIKPVGYGLDEKALETVKTWKFKPATLNGQPTSTRVVVEVAFHLHHPAQVDPPCPTPFAIAEMDGRDTPRPFWGEFSPAVDVWWPRQKESGKFPGLCAANRNDARYAIVWRSSPPSPPRQTSPGIWQNPGTPASGFADVFRMVNGQIQPAAIFTSKHTSSLRAFKEAVDYLNRQLPTAQ